MDFIDIIIYFGIAAIGGAINSVAGGGTFLTFPVLILNGLTPLQANVMSTIALWPGSVASAVAYRSQLQIERSRFKEFILVSVTGSAIGTALLLLLPEATFTRMVPWLLLFATLIFTFGHRGIGWFHQFSGAAIEGKRHAASVALQLFIAIYGGYFGAGIGILMLAMLQLMGMHDIHRMNALKTVLGSSINAVAVLLFVLAGKVVWSIAAVMIAGAISGGYLGARVALGVPPRHVRLLVSAIGAAMTVYFFLRG